MSSTLEELRQRYGDRHKWLVLLTVMIGSMAAIMSSTIVNVAVPDLSRHFLLGQERAQWVSAAFMLAMTLSMLTTPWLLLRFGLRRTYSGAILLLLAGGVAGGFSINYPMLLAMRVVEGLASGILQPIPAIVILRAFASHEQGKAMGIFGFGVVLAPAVGPGIGWLPGRVFRLALERRVLCTCEHHHGSVHAADGGPDRVEHPGRRRTAGRGGLARPGRQETRVSLWAKNLNGQYYWARSNSFYTLGYNTQTPGDPRTFGVTVDYRF